MFWALVLESGKQYSTTVEKSFHLSKAALDVGSVKSDNDILSVVFHSDGNEHILCNLSKSRALQESLDLNFIAGSEVVFECKGKGTVHLTGYIVPEDDFASIDEEFDDESESETEIKQSEDEAKKSLKKPQQAVVSPVKRKQEKQLAPDAKKLKQDSDSDSDEDDDDDDDDDEDDDDSMANGLMMSDDSDDSEDDDDDDEDDEDDDDDDDDDDDEDDDLLDLESEEVEDEEDSDDSSEEDDDDDEPTFNKKDQKTPNKTPQKDSGQKQAKTPQQQGKTPQQQGKTPQQQGKTPKENKTPNNKTPQPNAKSDKKQAKTPLTNGATPKGKDDKNTPAKTPKTPSKTLEGGVGVEDIKVGDGPVAKPGKFVNVYYVGRLKHNNKQFDASTSGPGFKFRLGKQEVIRGWDVGLNGMKVGGKRRITCPPEMAYGKKGALPTIPPNSSLVFDVELRSIS